MNCPFHLHCTIACKAVFLKLNPIPGLTTRILLIFSFSVLLISCKTKGKVQDSKTSGNYAKSIGGKAFDEAFYEGNKQMILGNHNEAVKKFKECVTLNDHSATASYLLAKEYNALRQYDISVGYARAAVKLDPTNVWYRKLLADNLTHTGGSEEAGAVYEYIGDKFETYEADYFDAAGQYMIAKKPNDALRCLDKLEKKKGVSEEVSFRKEDIFIRLNNKEKAIAEIQKLIRTYPKETRYRVALAEILYNFKEEDKAMKELESLLAADPSSSEAHMLLANIYRSKGQFEKSFEELKLVFKNPDADTKQKTQVLNSYIPLTGMNPTLRMQALELTGILVETNPDDEACNMVAGDVYYSCEKYAEARAQYLKASVKNKGNANLWQNLILCEDQLKLYTEAKAHADEAVEAFPNQAQFYYYKAYYAYRLKQYAEAAATAKNGYDLGSENPSLTIQLLTVLGDASNALKKYAESDEAYEKILSLDPNNFLTLNNYAYFLALRNEKLEKAESMSKKCLELDPNNATYLDTYAWVLYAQKRYADARTAAEKALSTQPNDATLNEHLGDIYYRMNDVANALKYWQKAKENGGNSDELNKKIQLKKLPE